LAVFCGVVGYVFAKVGVLQRQILFGPCVLFYLLNLMVVLQAKELCELQTHWFLSLHDFL
jgi:hypothetical protein